MLWDVIVVGAGPAGCAAAMAALACRPSASVLVLDRAAFPRDKACGDALSPHALDVLTRLGLEGLVDDYPPVHRLFLGYPVGAGEQVAARMQRPTRVVPRVVLDARLLEAARARGADFACHVVRSVEVQRDRVAVDGRWFGRVVIGADGAGSAVRRAMHLTSDRDGHVALAIPGYDSCAGTGLAEQRIVFDRSGDWPAYAWSFPIGDGTANVGYGRVLRADPQLSRARLLQDLQRLLPDVAGAAVRWRAHHLPLSSRRPRQPDGRLLLSGDALSLVNPLSAEGMFAAVCSGAAAGAAAVTGPEAGARYRSALRAEIGTHLRHTTLASTLARRPGWVDAVLRASRSDHAVFDDVVALSLGGGAFTRHAMRAMLGARLQTGGARP